MIKNSYISLTLISLLVTQTMIPAITIPPQPKQITPKQVDNYFIRLKRSIKRCLKLECSQEDLNNIYLAASTLLFAVGTLFFVKWARDMGISQEKAKRLGDLDTAITYQNIPEVRALMAKAPLSGTEQQIVTSLERIVREKRYLAAATDDQSLINHFNGRIANYMRMIEILKTKGFDPDKKYHRYDPDRFTSLRQEIQDLPEDLLIAIGLDSLAQGKR